MGHNAPRPINWALPIRAPHRKGWRKTMTNKTAPKVSVCIPVYNESAYIAESIESVIGHT